ncbi:MAG: AAA family ATPase [Hyphomicrobiales bacterium]
MGCTDSYDPPPATVERIETHASIVFLAGNFAYKVKRAVKYPFLDFSSLEKRHFACLNELRINTRTAPQLYLEVVPITREPGGGFRLRGGGEVAEWVLVMRRFDQEALFDHMAADGRLSLEMMGPLAEVIATFHASADRVLTQDQAVRPLEGVIRDHDEVLADNPDAFPSDEAQDFAQRTHALFAALSPFLRKRALAGYVRHCHGDLHLRNIVEVGGKPTLFDAIEFDDRLATIDVLYDVAFLLMDLGKRGLDAHANTVLNAYLDADGDSGNLLGLAALPFFLSLRAMIRAKVELLRGRAALRDKSAAISDDVRDYFALARRFLSPHAPQLIAVGGLSGSGKSAVARALAPMIGAFPGAVIVRSDIERKRLFAVDFEEKRPARAYAPEVSHEVYAMVRKKAALALAAGRSVIVDAVHAKPEERAAVAALAAAHGADFVGLWLDAPADVMQDRVARRHGDVSDATPQVVEGQLAYDLGKIDFHRVDASQALDAVVAACLSRVAPKA